MSNQRVTLPIRGMTCIACATTMERVLRRQDGVIEANANFIDRRVTIVYDTTKLGRDNLTQVIQRLGYKSQAGD